MATFVGTHSPVAALASHGRAAHHPLIPNPVARPKPATAPKLHVVNGPLPVRPVTSFAAGDKVALRPLIIALDHNDFGLPTWKTVLDRAGSPYDVLLAKTDPFDASRLVRPDGVGKYSAILLTDNALLYIDSGGNYVSAFDAIKWNTLWDYERTFHVRQVSLYTSYGTFPEDYCLRAGSEGAIGSPIQASLTSAGAQVFDYLKANAQIPISQSYLYRSKLASSCNAQPILTQGSDVLGVVSMSSDGRERAALTFSSNQYLMQTDLLGHGLLRWATKGVFLGERRHWIGVDVDDWFNYLDHQYPDGHVETDPGFRISGPEVPQVNQQQLGLRSQYPLAAGFTLNLPYNGSDIDPAAPPQCGSSNTPDPLTSYSRCLAGSFRWINHTLTHPKMNFTTYAQNHREIQNNLRVGRQVGLSVPTAVLKTPEYSGLGVYNPDPNAPDNDPPTDFGLAASNRDLLRAASDLGVKYLESNMSFASHRPSCFNCGTYHPLQPNLFLVPGWPTNISYQTTTPAEQTLFYNNFYGPNGKFPYFDHNLTYAEQLNYESDLALHRVMSGSAYIHTVHANNVHIYAPGKSLTFDWLQALMSKYSALYKVPLKNPDAVVLGKYAQARNAHFTALAANRDAVWDRPTSAISYTPTTTGSLYLTGATGGTSTSEKYGLDTIAHLSFTAGRTATVTARARL